MIRSDQSDPVLRPAPTKSAPKILNPNEVASAPEIPEASDTLALTFNTIRHTRWSIVLIPCT